MKLAFCLFRYFQFGGLQRDFRHIAEVCLNRGHLVHVFTMSWEGDKPSDFNVTVLPAKGFTNHRRCRNFTKDAFEYIKKGQFDVVIGFNKMPHLDIYYAADPCLKVKVKSLYRLLPRYRTYLSLEKAVFEPSASAEILLISEPEKEKFINCYNTQEKRFHTLPPGISKDRRKPENTEEIRESVHREFGIADDEFLLLMVGSGFKTKGLDRSIKALASLPETLRMKTKLFVIGHGKTKPFEKVAGKYKVSGQLRFLGGRDDVPRFLFAADLLLHPAYSENTGTVLIEAMASGLPVLATDICGYAYHIRDAEAGLLIASPFKQQSFNEKLKYMLLSSEREIWGENGLDYIKQRDVYSMPEKAADIIESFAGRGKRQ